MADRKITDFAAVSTLASGYIIPLVDLSEPTLIAQNKRTTIAAFDNRYLPVSGAAVSGSLLVPSGSAANPGLGVGTNNTGLFNTNGNTLGLASNGTQILTLNPSSAAFNANVTVSGARAVFTNISGSNASYTSVSGQIGKFINLITSNISGTSASFTTVSGNSAEFASLSGTQLVSTNVNSSSGIFTSLSGLTIFATSSVITNLSGNLASFNVISGASAQFSTVSGANAVFASISGTNAYFPNIIGPTNIAGSLSGTKIQVSSGTQNTPGVAVGQTDTGLYLSSSNTLGFTAGSQQIFELSASGIATVIGSGALDLPVGTTAQRPSASQGMIRFNTDRPGFEGYNGTAWTPVGGGATGSGVDEVFVLNQQFVTGSYTLPSGYNASSAGPITVTSGVVVTIPSGSAWVVI